MSIKILNFIKQNRSLIDRQTQAPHLTDEQLIAWVKCERHLYEWALAQGVLSNMNPLQSVKLSASSNSVVKSIVGEAIGIIECITAKGYIAKFPIDGGSVSFSCTDQDLILAS